MPEESPPRDAGPGGLPADRYGNPAIDPTANVIALVDLQVRRMDDLRSMSETHQHEMILLIEKNLNEKSAMRAEHAKAMQENEAQRLDAIRSVDVAAVQQAATVQAAAASALETTVSAAAETLRTTVAATAAAAATELRSTVAPLTEAIADLRRVQYEQQGQRVAAVETKATNQVTMGTIIAIAGTILLFVSVIAAVVGLLISQ